MKMVKKTYQVQVQDEKKTAKAYLTNQRISIKYSTEMCREIKGKPLTKADKFLDWSVLKGNWIYNLDDTKTSSRINTFDI